MTVNWRSEVAVKSTCPACGHGDAVEILDVKQDGCDLVYHRCSICSSVYPERFVDTGDLGGYAIGRSEHDIALKHYVEVGAGVNSLLKPILSVVDEPRGSMLDVGCGFGFLPALWQNHHPDNVAHGIELASYGYWGRDLIQAPVSHELLASNATALARKYDIVFSGEVIEHVEDPAEFLQDLKSVMAPDGVLVLTTPDAACVNTSTSQSEMMAALYIGAHRVLFSRTALEAHLRAASFAYVIVRVTGTSLIAWAADRPITLIGEEATRVSAFTDKFLLSLAENPNPWVKGGALFRLFREAVNRGDLDVARAYNAGLVECIESVLGDESGWWSAIKKVMRESQTAEDYLQSLPSYMGPYLYYRAMMELNLGGDALEVSVAFDRALQLNVYGVETYSHISTEAASLISTCLFHRQMTLSRAALGVAGYQDCAKRQDPRGTHAFASRFTNELAWPISVELAEQAVCDAD